jgi:hypothetical protein
MSAYCHPVASCGDFMACTAAMSCRLRGLVPKRHYNVHLVVPNRAPPQPFRHRVDLRGLSQHQRDNNSFKLEQQSAQSLSSQPYRSLLHHQRREPANINPSCDAHGRQPRRTPKRRPCKVTSAVRAEVQILGPVAYQKRYGWYRTAAAKRQPLISHTWGAQAGTHAPPQGETRKQTLLEVFRR